MIVSNPLESDVEVSKVDWVAPPSIDTQLIDSVTLLDDQGDDKAKENQSKGDGDISKTIFLGLDPTPDIIVISAIYFVEGALGLACLKQTFLLKDELHLSPPEMSATMGIFGVAVDNQAIVWISQQWVPHCARWTNFKQELWKQFQGKCPRMVISIVAGSNHKCLHVDILSY